AAVSFDPGRRITDRDYAEAFRLADVVFFNDREAAAALSANPDTLSGCVVIEKRGRAGAEVRWDGEASHHAGFDVEPADST
ncbi:MAG: carbohydrate kinase family protein, partial [Actinobacteria bacterium]|nr:carbohydrate kinase family protein [Actinomycetota bacterium]NIU64021.1 carbohydrate kinase family protein [Actinomycetota bacterium]NIW25820.1 carbohydrate kinase family protein [Actinomycetota bacterium]NIX20689.1 carbohydrate kinase family protein [Actinomycetota bacterium]